MRDLLIRAFFLVSVVNARAAQLVAAELDRFAADYRARISAQMYDIATTGSAFTEISPEGIRRLDPRDVIPGPIAPLSHRAAIALAIVDGLALGLVIGVWILLWR